MNFAQGEDKGSVICQKDDGWILTDSFYKVVKHLHEFDWVTVLEFEQEITKDVEERNVKIFCELLGSTTTVLFAAVRKE